MVEGVINESRLGVTRLITAPTDILSIRFCHPLENRLANVISGDVNSEMGLLKERMGAVWIRALKLLGWVCRVVIQNMHLEALLLRKLLSTVLTLIRIDS